MEKHIKQYLETEIKYLNKNNKNIQVYTGAGTE